MRSALIRNEIARKSAGRQANRSSPKAEVTGSNPVGCASSCCFACIGLIVSCQSGRGVRGACLRYWR